MDKGRFALMVHNAFPDGCPGCQKFVEVAWPILAAALAEARRAARLEEATGWQQRFQKYLVECGNVDTNVDSGQPEAERIAALHEASKAPQGDGSTEAQI